MIVRITGNSLSLSAMVKRWVMPTVTSVFSSMGIWLVVCLVSPCIAGSVTQEGATGIDARGTPRITATPERVKVSDDSASCDIAWNTGNGSKGFVFMTANRRPPVLLATGNEGSRRRSNRTTPRRTRRNRASTRVSPRYRTPRRRRRTLRRRRTEPNRALVGAPIDNRARPPWRALCCSEDVRRHPLGS